MLGLMDEICRGSSPSSYMGCVILVCTCTKTPFIRGFIALSCSSLPLDADSERSRDMSFLRSLNGFHMGGYAMGCLMSREQFLSSMDDTVTGVLGV